GAPRAAYRSFTRPLLASSGTTLSISPWIANNGTLAFARPSNRSTGLNSFNLAFSSPAFERARGAFDAGVAGEVAHGIDAGEAADLVRVRGRPRQGHQPAAASAEQHRLRRVAA